jgi:hypothetical protein
MVAFIPSIIRPKVPEDAASHITVTVSDPVQHSEGMNKLLPSVSMCAVKLALYQM